MPSSTRALLCLLVLGGGCVGGEADDCEVEDAAIVRIAFCPDPPAPLERAASIRAAGGVVVVGEVVVADRIAAEPLTVATGSGFVSYQSSELEYRVEDDLGASVPGRMTVAAWDGYKYVSDAEGRPRCDVPEPGASVCHEASVLHAEGRRLPFLQRTATGRWWLDWSSQVIDGQALYSATAVSVDEFQL